MFTPTVQQPKKKPAAFTNDSILEALRDLSSGVGKTVSRDVAGRVSSDVLSSLFGKMPNRQGEMQANEQISLGSERRSMNPVRRPEVIRQPMIRREEVNLKQQIDAVRQELKAIAQSLKSLQQEVQKAVDDVPVEPGIYHLNFMARLRSVLLILREQIEDSRSWLALFTSRKKQKNYWGMVKKHGTKFGLSSERTMATQAG